MSGMSEPLTLAQAWARQPGPEVPSPCTRVCQIDAVRGWCQGCQRTLEEIAAWSRLDAEGRLAIWQQIAQRRQAPGAAEV